MFKFRLNTTEVLFFSLTALFFLEQRSHFKHEKFLTDQLDDLRKENRRLKIVSDVSDEYNDQFRKILEREGIESTPEDETAFFNIIRRHIPQIDHLK